MTSPAMQSAVDATAYLAWEETQAEKHERNAGHHLADPT